jgi:hypothetical protein
VLVINWSALAADVSIQMVFTACALARDVSIQMVCTACALATDVSKQMVCRACALATDVSIQMVCTACGLATDVRILTSVQRQTAMLQNAVSRVMKRQSVKPATEYSCKVKIDEVVNILAGDYMSVQ